MDTAGIYIHFPFCKRKCFYCHFVKHSFDAASVERYVQALGKEIKLRRGSGYLVDTVYLGGGSPSLLSSRQLVEIVETLRAHFRFAESIEFTMELNPEDVTPEKLRAYRDAGVNRLSIGTQSFVEADLHYLQRTHDSRKSLEAIETALGEGFENLNIDFIISLPSQTKESLEQNINLLQRYAIPHVSAYILEGVIEGEEKDSRDHEFYFLMRQFMEGLGYGHYEVSNFSKPGFEARHNLKYWRNQDYIGLGLAASGFEGGVDYRNTSQLDTYFASIATGTLPRKETETANISLRRIIMGLRLSEGIPETCFESVREPLEFLLSHGMLVSKGNRIALHPDKTLLLNEILTYF